MSEAAARGTAGRIDISLAGRDRQLDVLNLVLDEASEGRATTAVVLGPHGSGRSALLAEASRQAHRRGFVLTTLESPWPMHRPDVVLSATGPQLVVLDDAQLALPRFLDLLRRLAYGNASRPLAIAIGWRDDMLPARQALPPALARFPNLVRVDLTPVSHPALRDWLSTMYPLPETDLDRLAARLSGDSAGVPLFIRELLSTLLRDGVIAAEPGGRWRLAPSLPAAVPATLREPIESRLAGLRPRERLLLATASVLRSSIRVADWRAVSRASASELTRVAEHAEALGVLHSLDEAAGLRFVMDVVRRHLYQRLSASRRAVLHRRAGEHMVRRGGDPSAATQHFLCAGDRGAVVSLTTAAGRALAVGDRASAVHHLRAALSLLDAARDLSLAGELSLTLGWLQPPDAETEARCLLATAADTAERLQDNALTLAVLAASGRRRYRAGHWARAVADLTAAAAVSATADWDRARNLLGLPPEWPAPAATAALVAADTGLPEPVASPVAGSSGDCADSALSRGLVAALRAEPREATAAWVTARARYSALGDQTAATRTALLQLTRVWWRYQADRPRIGEALAAEAGRPGAGGDLQLPAGFSRLPMLVLVGRWDQVDELAAWGAGQGAVLAELAWCALVRISRARGDEKTAWATVNQALPAGPASRPGRAPVALALQMLDCGARLHLDNGDHAAAEIWVQAQERWMADTGTLCGRAEVLLARSRLADSAADLHAARAWAERALCAAGSPHQPLESARAHRRLARLAARAGNYHEAFGLLARATTLSRDCADVHGALTAQVDRAQTLALAGRAAEAQAAAASLRPQADRLGAAPLRSRLLALGCAGTGGATPHITARQLEVLRLLAAGHPNGGIAERLGISRRTVEHHLEAAYLALGVTNRTAAVRAARESGALATPRRCDETVLPIPAG